MADFVSTPNILWKISNFVTSSKDISPSIYFSGLKWKLMYYVFDESDTSKKIQLVLECLSTSDNLPLKKFITDTFIVNTDGALHLPQKTACSLKMKGWHIYTEHTSNIYKIFDKVDDITFFITIKPSGELKNSFQNEKIGKENFEMSPCVRSLCEDMQKLFNNNNESDFTLKCGQRNFPVHKAILSARSDFFAAMFRNEMTEAIDSEGEIKEMEPDILEQTLHYLYTGTIPNLSMDSVHKICEAADRFFLDPLKIMCSVFFMNTVTDKNKDLEDTKDNAATEPLPTEEEGIIGEAEEKTLTEPVITKSKQWQRSKEKQLLRDLFLTKEWILFSQEFPFRALDMCKPYFGEKE